MTDFETAAKEAANTAKSALEAYQATWTNIAKENMQFAVEFGQALTTARTPSDLFDVTTEYSKKRFDAFQRHTKELMSSYPAHQA